MPKVKLVGGIKYAKGWDKVAELVEKNDMVQSSVKQVSSLS